MEWKKILIVLFAGTLCFSCKEKTPESIVRPVKSIEAGSGDLSGKTFPGYAEAEEYAFLNFRVGGMLEALNVEEGQNVSRGTIIAALDQRDYQLKVSSTRADYQEASSRVERYKNLYSREAISKQEYEISQAAFENARAAYNKAVNDLQYTRITAPFSGNIEKKYVENFQQVMAGEKIVKLVNPEKLQFRFVLPENDWQAIRDSATFSIALDDDPSMYYRASLFQVVSASSGGAGIPVILKISDPGFDAKKLKVLPGYACLVKVDAKSTGNQVISIPLSAVYSDPHTNETSVWKIDTVHSTVHRIPVKTGELTGSEDIIILSGIQPGERIITAGITMLKEGETVKMIDDESR